MGELVKIFRVNELQELSFDKRCKYISSYVEKGKYMKSNAPYAN